MTQIVPLREGLYREDQNGTVLTGGQCPQCGFVGFPKPLICPECGSDAVEPADLGSHGRLLCETTVHMRTDVYASGYRVGYVTMEHGVRVFGQVHAANRAPLRPGELMKVEVARMWKEGEKEVQCYRFRPAGRTTGEGAT